MGNNFLTMPELKTAVRMYGDGLPSSQIARHLDRGDETIRAALKSVGVKLKVGRPKNSGMPNPWAHSEARVLEDAICGSERLLRAIQRAGVRP